MRSRSAASLVSIHASARDATYCSITRPSDATIEPVLFQSTRPRGTRLGHPEPYRVPYQCFNPRVREGRDLASFRCLSLSGVSIHASARDATLRFRELKARDFVSVSIHASARDATLGCAVTGLLSSFCFNPRVREGRDAPQPLCYCNDRLFQSTRPRGTRPTGRRHAQPAPYVSIHASARDATLAQR